MYNKTTLFCLAMIKPDFSQSSYKLNFSNAFLNIDGVILDNQIALLYSSFPDNTEGSHDVISLPNNEYLIIYPIEKEHLKDFEHFKNGQYSKFSESLKQKIGKYFGYNSKCYYATIKHLSLKANIEKELNIKLPADAEYYSIMDKQEETFNLVTND